MTNGPYFAVATSVHVGAWSGDVQPARLRQTVTTASTSARAGCCREPRSRRAWLQTMPRPNPGNTAGRSSESMAASFGINTMISIETASRRHRLRHLPANTVRTISASTPHQGRVPRVYHCRRRRTTCPAPTPRPRRSTTLRRSRQRVEPARAADNADQARRQSSWRINKEP